MMSMKIGKHGSIDEKCKRLKINSGGRKGSFSSMKMISRHVAKNPAGRNLKKSIGDQSLKKSIAGRNRKKSTADMKKSLKGVRLPITGNSHHRISGKGNWPR